jgi:hypothetical protein
MIISPLRGSQALYSMIFYNHGNPSGLKIQLLIKNIVNCYNKLIYTPEINSSSSS